MKNITFKGILLIYNCTAHVNRLLNVSLLMDCYSEVLVMKMGFVITAEVLKSYYFSIGHKKILTNNRAGLIGKSFHCEELVRNSMFTFFVTGKIGAERWLILCQNVVSRYTVNHIG